MLNDNVLLGKAQSVDYPGLLADVLDGLMSMADENWEERAQASREMLRAVDTEG